jgi:hypothetical protein
VFACEPVQLALHVFMPVRPEGGNSPEIFGCYRYKSR